MKSVLFTGFLLSMSFDVSSWRNRLSCIVLSKSLPRARAFGADSRMD